MCRNCLLTLEYFTVLKRLKRFNVEPRVDEVIEPQEWLKCSVLERFQPFSTFFFAIHL